MARTPRELPSRLQPRRVPRQRRSAELVQAITEAAAQELVARGWDTFSMARVAQRAGVSPGSLYQYFPDKASLVAELIEQQSEREVAFQLEQFAQADLTHSLEALLSQLVASTLAFQRREGALMRATLAAMPHVGRHPKLVARVREVSGVLLPLFEHHRAALGETEPAVALHVIVNVVHSLTHDGVLPRPEAMSDETLHREAMKLLRGYLTTRP